MSQSTLVAAHLSSVFSSSGQVSTHVVPTTRRDIPLPSSQPVIPDEHASFSSLYHSPRAGHILIRIVKGGLAVELVSLSRSIAPARFLFPASVLPAPALVEVKGKDELHLLAVTSFGSIFRIAMPLSGDNQLWNEPLVRDWCREDSITKLSSTELKLVHVVHPTKIVIGLASGGFIGYGSQEDALEQYHWKENERATSSWYTALLQQAIPSSSSQPSEIVSFASIPPPTDLEDIFSVSRDFVLRRWSQGGCRSEITLNSKHHSSGNGEKAGSLLDASPQKLLQTLRISRDGFTQDHYLLTFLPTPSSTTAGGHFRLYQIDNNRWDVVSEFVTSAASVNCRLQDFVHNNGTLSVLWENQGESLLDITKLPFGAGTPHWTSAVYGRNAQLTDTALDEDVPDLGSLADRFLQFVLRPGIFSTLTLRQALAEYKDHYLSLPGPYPSALLASHATLSEGIAAVVGCSVKLTHDVQTGFALHKQYRNALRRDWEGFIARCKEMERSARWPLALGVKAEKGQVLIFERERICQGVEEDKPMEIYRTLFKSEPEDIGHLVLTISCDLRKKLPLNLTRRIEDESLNIIAQEISFPLVDILFAASNRVLAHEDLDDEVETWLELRLNSIRQVDGFDNNVRRALDIITHMDKCVKQEEDEVELIIPSKSSETSEWDIALISSYAQETIQVRYDLCMALAVLLFFAVEKMDGNDDSAFLAEVFAVLRGVAMARLVARQTAGDLDGSKPSNHDAEDVVTRMSSLNVHLSRSGKNPLPTYSLIHQLVSRSGYLSNVPSAAHVFIDQLALLSLDSLSSVTKAEIVLCDRLRLLGYREIARQVLAWLPRTPAVCHVLGRLWVDAGRCDDAVLYFNGVAGSFGPDSVLSDEDHEALASVLPSGALFPSDFDYYIHVAEIFKNAGVLSEELSFTKLALSVLPEGEDSTDLWNCVIKGYTDLGLYDAAYSSLLAAPQSDSRRQNIADLVNKMCEDEALDQLLSMSFQGFEAEVEDPLLFKARNADPRIKPNYGHILYTWYSSRGDFRNAALVMYLRARKLAELSVEAKNPAGYGEQRLEALVIAMNGMKLLNQQDAWVLVPLPVGTTQARKRRRVEGYIPDEQFTSGVRDVDIVTVKDMEQEYILLNSSLELLRRDSTAVLTEGLLSTWIVVSKLTQSGNYDLALQTAKGLDVDMTETFQRLVMQCLRLSASPESTLIESSSVDWLLTDKVSSWSGSPADRGWRYLRQCLEQYDSIETDFKYSKAVLETLLSHGQYPPPPWLLLKIKDHQPDHLIRSYLKFGIMDEALMNTLELVQKSSNWSRPGTGDSCRTWLPYSLIDTLLKCTEDSTTPSVQALRDTIQTELKKRIARLRKQSEKAP